VVNGGGQPPANPPMDPMLPPAPNTGLIVQKQGANWVDDTGGIWNSHVGMVAAGQRRGADQHHHARP
jgi:hypothetical protein